MQVNTACYECVAYVSQGLFERHKLIFICQLCFRILAHAGIPLLPDLTEFPLFL
jgi:hypothetical protein